MSQERVPAAGLRDGNLGRKKSDETVDALFQGRLKLYQSRSGYRFSLDAVLLARFARIKPGEKAADLGTGNGVIPLIWVYLDPSLSVTGVETQQSMAERARKSVQLNGFEKRITILHGDVRAIDRIAEPESHDVVVCNPPYREPSSGRVSPNSEKQIARHEIKGSLHDFLRAGDYLLPVKGRMAVIYQAARCLDLLEAMREVGIEPKRLRMVHSFADAVASLVLVEGVKGGRSALKVLAPLVIYERDKKYTFEVQSMLAG
jgi:tRNA1Val (adenine37-N6)-methyltransferase